MERSWRLRSLESLSMRMRPLDADSGLDLSLSLEFVLAIGATLGSSLEPIGVVF